MSDEFIDAARFEATRNAADTLGADWETAEGRIGALHAATLAMVGPASKPHEEAQVLLCGALVRACRASEDQLKALFDATATLKYAWNNTMREHFETEDQDGGA